MISLGNVQDPALAVGKLVKEFDALVRELLMGFLHGIGIIEQGLEPGRLPGIAGGSDRGGGYEIRSFLAGTGTAGRQGEDGGQAKKESLHHGYKDSKISERFLQTTGRLKKPVL